jgi:hypothetical protein
MYGLRWRAIIIAITATAASRMIETMRSIDCRLTGFENGASAWGNFGLRARHCQFRAIHDRATELNEPYAHDPRRADRAARRAVADILVVVLDRCPDGLCRGHLLRLL